MAVIVKFFSFLEQTLLNDQYISGTVHWDTLMSKNNHLSVLLELRVKRGVHMLIR